MEPPKTVTRTKLWTRTLEVHVGDPERPSKQFLQQSFLSARSNAGFLVSEIPRQLPEFTDHSLVHLDSLWEMADILSDGEFPLNSAESFVFGVSVLLHDCAMSLAAYPGGMAEIVNSLQWRDVLSIASDISDSQSIAPTFPDVDNLERRALSMFLRINHARKAEELATQHWVDPNGGHQYLIAEPSLRAYAGNIIGKIAHSHHWPIERLALDLPPTLGAMTGFPPEWTISPVKIACLLRAADASHLDERRAPGFLWALRQLPEFSERHWRFQNRLTVPQRSGDELVITSAQPFVPTEAESWWLCYETIQMIDRELRGIDALLADRREPRLAVRRVAGANNPTSMLKYVRVEGWRPVDAAIHVGDVPRLVERLGGRQLYGDRPWIVLRELLQNSMDAVRARRSLEGRPSAWGEISVWTEAADTSDSGWTLSIADNGIGMSIDCIQRYLLNVGASYWRSDLLSREHPGLISRSVYHDGKFGIGFFSVTMIAEKIKVVTRSTMPTAADTLVLEFPNGFRARPLIRHPTAEEHRLDFGTTVTISIKTNILSIKTNILEDDHEDEFPAFRDEGFRSFGKDVFSAFGMSKFLEIGTDLDELDRLVQFICPASDVTIKSGPPGTHQERISVTGGDWLTLDAHRFLSRVSNGLYYREKLSEDSGNQLPFRMIIDRNGRTLGRARWGGGEGGSGVCLMVTEGGIRIAELRQYPWQALGIVIGSAGNLQRDVAVAIDREAMAKWATEQGRLSLSQEMSPWWRASLATTIDAMGGSIDGLPIAFFSSRWIHEIDLRSALHAHDLVTISEIAGDNTDYIRGHSIDEWGPVISFTSAYFFRAQDHRHGDFLRDEVRFGDGDDPAQFPRGMRKYALRAIRVAWSMSGEELMNCLNRSQIRDITYGDDFRLAITISRPHVEVTRMRMPS